MILQSIITPSKTNLMGLWKTTMASTTISWYRVKYQCLGPSLVEVSWPGHHTFLILGLHGRPCTMAMPNAVISTVVQTDVSDKTLYMYSCACDVSVLIWKGEGRSRHIRLSTATLPLQYLHQIPWGGPFIESETRQISAVTHRSIKHQHSRQKQSEQKLYFSPQKTSNFD